VLASKLSSTTTTKALKLSELLRMPCVQFQHSIRLRKAARSPIFGNTARTGFVEAKPAMNEIPSSTETIERRLAHACICICTLRLAFQSTNEPPRQGVTWLDSGFRKKGIHPGMCVCECIVLKHRGSEGDETNNRVRTLVATCAKHVAKGASSFQPNRRLLPSTTIILPCP
jgi:hypothetical protein